jgi:nicotinamidase-related amidase
LLLNPAVGVRIDPVSSPKTALLILDLISEFKFEGAQRLLRPATRLAPRIAHLKCRAHAAHLPVIYLNDTAGKWESDQTAFIQRCLAEGARGRGIVRQVLPQADDYFIFKPKHSGFYATPLTDLLEMLNVDNLILTGLTSHQCVLFTAVDAHMRGYDLLVPRDCIAASSAAETAHALFIFERALNAKIYTSKSLPLS